MEENSNKKSTFDDLSRDELIKKCKAMLIIAQKAKQAKTDLIAENESLKDKCQGLETQKHADKESLRTMQEFMTTLTEQKLNFTTEIDTLKSQLVNYKSASEEGKKIEGELKARLTQTDTENTSLKRQNNRLQDENEKLINRLDELEKQIDVLNKLDLDRREQLEKSDSELKLCQNNSDIERLIKEIDEYKKKLEATEEENSLLIGKCQDIDKIIEEKVSHINELRADVVDLKKKLSDAENRILASENKVVETEKQYETEKIKKEKLNLKLKSYREKLLVCNSSIAQLKNAKSVLLKTVTDYSGSIPKWQRDILDASKLISEQLLQLETANEDLKNRLSKMNSAENEQESHEKLNNLSNENILLGSKLNSLMDEIAKLEEENLNLRDHAKSMKVEYDQLYNNAKSFESEKKILINEKKSARETIQKIELDKSELKSENIHLRDSIERLNAEVNRLNKSFDTMKIEKREFTNKLKASTSSSNDNKSAAAELVSLKEEIVSLKCALVSIEEENKLLHESNEAFKSQLESSSEMQISPEMREILVQNDLLQAEISRLQNKITSYKSENISLHSEVKDSRQKLLDIETMLQDYENMKSKFSNYKSENAELLKEMKEINQALKERGEVISKKYMEISELNNKCQSLEEEIRDLKEVSAKKDAEIVNISEKNKEMLADVEKSQTYILERDNFEALLKERDGIIVSLHEDIERLKQNQGNMSYDAPSDSLSVSTMSRIEETSRLKDVDDSFEERYSKLRMLALKLKKRVNELSLENKNLEETNAKIEQEKNEAIQKLSTLPCSTRDTENLQEQIDSEEKKTSEPNKTKSAGKFTKDLSSAKEKIDSLLQDIEYSKMEKASLSIALKEIQSQFNTLKNKNEEYKSKEAEYNKLKDTLTLKESQLTLEESQHQITKEALEKAKREVKKKSVLSLEMEDYERSMKDLTNKMEDDKKKIVQMESTIDTQQATISSLKTQIKMLEDQLSSEEKVIKEMKELLHNATENAKDNENTISLKNEIIYKLEKDLEDVKLQSEDLNLQLASTLGEREKSIIIFEQEKSELIMKYKAGENKFNDIEEKLKMKSTELEELKGEFSRYKMRAQSVLKQNNKKDLTVEENLKEEMAALKAEIENSKSETETLKSELETVQMEKCRLLNRCGELQSTISASQAERESIAEQYSVLLQKEIQEQKNIKLQMTTLTQCYKKQIAELEESTAQQIMKLKKELEFSRASIARVNIPLKENNVEKKPLQFIAINSIDDVSDNKDNIDSGEINVSLLEREEGEGSESTPSPSPTNNSNLNRLKVKGKREPMPLDQLLEMGVAEDPAENDFEVDIELRLSSALKQIEIKDKRLSHLTELVAEAEKEVARRSQLIETLKEEVRRGQRALERGHHHHNQEYLKNVIVKFLTLNAGDERSRLVPVLNTILTLSPEETQQLNAAAKGMDPNANRGWGSYLPWPGNR